MRFTSPKVLVGVFSLALAIYLLMHYILSGDASKLIRIANSIPLGISEERVLEIASASTVSHIKTSEWSVFKTGLLSQWLLYVHYTNGVVDFVGIVDSDRRLRRPDGVPQWRSSEGFQFDQAIRKGTSSAVGHPDL